MCHDEDAKQSHQVEPGQLYSYGDGSVLTAMGWQ